MKKNFVVGVASTVVIIAIVVLMVFVFSGKDEENSFSLSGIWKVAVNVNDGTVSIPQDEFMVFSDNNASDYRDGNAEPFVKSTFKISEDVLELPDISKTYHVVQHTDTCISLYTNDATFVTLVQAESESFMKEPLDTNTVVGKWSVVYRPTEKPIVNEYLFFHEGVLKDYRDNSEQPAIEAAYEWNGCTIKVPDLGVEMFGARIGSNRIVLVDVHQGFVWLLTEVE